MNFQNSIQGVNGRAAPSQQQSSAIPWSFTGPPPGQFPAPHAFHSGHLPVVHGPPIPRPYMMGQMAVAYPHQVPFGQGPPPPQFMAYSRPPYPDPGQGPSGCGAQQISERKYANKKERDRAKKDRKEARKLAENPLEPITEDAQPRPFLNDTERQETLQWIADRKASFPTRALVEKKAAASATLSEAGGSGGRSKCDECLFTVLQEQHSRGLLRSAGTEELFRSFLARGRGRGSRGGRGARGGRGRGQGGGQGTRCQAPTAGCTAAVEVTGVANAASAETEKVELPVEQKNSNSEPHKTDVHELESDSNPNAGLPVSEERTGRSVKAPCEGDMGCMDRSGGLAGGCSPEAIQRNEGQADCPHVVDASMHEPEDVLGKRKACEIGGKSKDAARKAPKQQPGWQREGPISGQQHKPCLLHRLIAPDVRQDRSLLLQVLRFFVANNFLQDSDQELKFPGREHCPTGTEK